MAVSLLLDNNAFCVEEIVWKNWMPEPERTSHLRRSRHFACNDY